jgi:dihydropteroate synthase
MRVGRFHFSGDEPLIMGVINVTPDSFSDGGQHADTATAIAHGLRLIEQGAAILDIGGESTRPGAPAISVDTELERVLPVLEALHDAGAALSVDTRKPAVMRAVLAAGADMINDIEGFRSQAAIDAVAESPDCGLCVMHMQGLPASMQDDPRYHRVTDEVADWLTERATALRTAGIGAERIVIDPGIGFGKRLEHNLELLACIDRLSAIAPVLIGVSRKSMLGLLTGRAVDERLPASLAAMLAAVARGARIVRVHDVRETRDALLVWRAIAAADASASA